MNTTVDQAAIGDKSAHKDPLYAQQGEHVALLCKTLLSLTSFFQLAATSPMGGGAVADPNVAPLPKLPFKEQVGRQIPVHC
jgi:hypothetical protein